VEYGTLIFEKVGLGAVREKQTITEGLSRKNDQVDLKGLLGLAYKGRNR